MLCSAGRADSPGTSPGLLAQQVVILAGGRGAVRGLSGHRGGRGRGGRAGLRGELVRGRGRGLGDLGGLGGLGSDGPDGGGSDGGVVGVRHEGEGRYRRRVGTRG